MSLPQREGRPALSIAPDESTSLSKSWTEDTGASACKLGYDAGNDRNDPVDVRKGKPDPNGWVHEAYDTTQTDDV